MKQLTYEAFQELEQYFNASSNTDDYGFYRSIAFTCLEQTYKITWYENLSYLFIGEAQICFTHFRIGGTWPNRFAENLMLMDDSGNYVAIIPTKEKP